MAGQVVVHNRRFEGNNLHELFSYNLYPGAVGEEGCLPACC